MTTAWNEVVLLEADWKTAQDFEDEARKPYRAAAKDKLIAGMRKVMPPGQELEDLVSSVQSGTLNPHSPWYSVLKQFEKDVEDQVATEDQRVQMAAAAGGAETPIEPLTAPATRFSPDPNLVDVADTSDLEDERSAAAAADRTAEMDRIAKEREEYSKAASMAPAEVDVGKMKMGSLTRPNWKLMIVYRPPKKVTRIEKGKPVQVTEPGKYFRVTTREPPKKDKPESEIGRKNPAKRVTNLEPIEAPPKSGDLALRTQEMLNIPGETKYVINTFANTVTGATTSTLMRWDSKSKSLKKIDSGDRMDLMRKAEDLANFVNKEAASQDIDVTRTSDIESMPSSDVLAPGPADEAQYDDFDVREVNDKSGAFWKSKTPEEILNLNIDPGLIETEAARNMGLDPERLKAVIAVATRAKEKKKFEKPGVGYGLGRGEMLSKKLELDPETGRHVMIADPKGPQAPAGTITTPWTDKQRRDTAEIGKIMQDFVEKYGDYADIAQKKSDAPISHQTKGASGDLSDVAEEEAVYSDISPDEICARDHQIGEPVPADGKPICGHAARDHAKGTDGYYECMHPDCQTVDDRGIQDSICSTFVPGNSKERKKSPRVKLNKERMLDLVKSLQDLPSRPDANKQDVMHAYQQLSDFFGIVRKNYREKKRNEVVDGIMKILFPNHWNTKDPALKRALRARTEYLMKGVRGGPMVRKPGKGGKEIERTPFSSARTTEYTPQQLAKKDPEQRPSLKVDPKTGKKRHEKLTPEEMALELSWGIPEKYLESDDPNKKGLRDIYREVLKKADEEFSGSIDSDESGDVVRTGSPYQSALYALASTLGQVSRSGGHGPKADQSFLDRLSSSEVGYRGVDAPRKDKKGSVIPLEPEVVSDPAQKTATKKAEADAAAARAKEVQKAQADTAQARLSRQQIFKGKPSGPHMNMSDEEYAAWKAEQDKKQAQVQADIAARLAAQKKEAVQLDRWLQKMNEIADSDV